MKTRSWMKPSSRHLRHRIRGTGPTFRPTKRCALVRRKSWRLLGGHDHLFSVWIWTYKESSASYWDDSQSPKRNLRSFISLTLMNYKTVKEIRAELEHRGGRLEKVLDWNQIPSTSNISPRCIAIQAGHYVCVRTELSGLGWAKANELKRARLPPLVPCALAMTLHDLGLMCLLLSPPIVMMSIFLWTFAAGG